MSSYAAAFKTKNRAFVNLASDSEESDDDFESGIEAAKASGLDSPSKAKKKGCVRKVKQAARKKAKTSSDDDDDDLFGSGGEVEAMKPLVSLDFLSDDDGDDDDDGAEGNQQMDAGSTRRLELLKEAREARDALWRAEQEVVVLGDDDDAADDDAPNLPGTTKVNKSPKKSPAARGSQGKADEAPVAFTYRGAELTLTTRANGKTATHHKLRTDEPFKYLFADFAADRGVNVAACNFLFDGILIKPDQTPKDHDLEDGDLLDVAAPPPGDKRPKPPRAAAAASSSRPPAATADDDEDSVFMVDDNCRPPSRPPTAADPEESGDFEYTRRVEAPPRRDRRKVTIALKTAAAPKAKKFKIWDDDKFAKCFKEYAKVSGFTLSTATFSYNGTAIREDQTPASLSITEFAKIAVALA